MKKGFALGVVILVATAGAVGLKAFIASSRTLQADVHHRIDNRAQLNLFEDFRHGLDSWDGLQPIGRTWSYDPSGLVIPGELSLFKPSMQLTDYDVETWAEIVNKGFSLVFRASGPRSYHALRFTSQGSGAAASIAVERYTIIGGNPSPRYPLHYPIPVWKDHDCRIRLQARGDSFTLYVNGQLVDHWSDSRLTKGGVGLFCGPGERTRIVWMRISHQTDLTGKLCALVSWLSSTTSEQ